MLKGWIQTVQIGRMINHQTVVALSRKQNQRAAKTQLPRDSGRPSKQIVPPEEFFTSIKYPNMYKLTTGILKTNQSSNVSYKYRVTAPTTPSYLKKHLTWTIIGLGPDGDI